MNLGTPAVEALARLKDNEDWKIVRDSIGIYAGKLMNDAITSPAAERVHHTSYAAGVRDLFISLHTERFAAVPKPGVKANAAS